MNSLIGLWLFTSIIYHDTPAPRPNPDLMMTFKFSESESVLHYYRKNQPGFCERTATYTYDGQTLHQTITAVHEGNADFCDKDPDMQMGAVSETPVVLKDGKIHMQLKLGEEDITYIWDPYAPVR
ncbi:hypothetical protein AZI86_01140 [Bdellovibrio bacteriovorus]|uniref:Lipocalin-like domain-containing protein n=1 Tax=Bdellovibrio bacteriovorus TaxID=959 RepID=A0A150WMJ4_BDEBC|nr:lipocalin family protein [Bdellovibrio bacteriovorus]KYG65711.1 hypothetical protein AZI86_01140 [Bdellovibrio bacteriovorus]